MTNTIHYAAPVQNGPNNFGDTREDGAAAGPIAFLLIALLALGTVLLIRNMNKRIRRLPQSFEAKSDPGEENR